jgi:hypothetical protein
VRGRWNLAYEALAPESITPWTSVPYPETETPEQAVQKALQFWDEPTISEETRAELLRFAAAAVPAVLQPWERGPMRAQRQNALRHLIVTSPDLQTC